MALAEDISRQPSIDSVMWLLVITLMQTNHEKETAGQRETQNDIFEEKRSTRKCNRAKSRAQGDKTNLKKT